MKEARLIISQALPVPKVGVNAEILQRRCDFVHGLTLPADMDCPSARVPIDREIEVWVLRRDFSHTPHVRRVAIGDGDPMSGHGVLPIIATGVFILRDTSVAISAFPLMPALQPAFQLP